MNYAGKFGAGGLDSLSSAHGVDIDSLSHHGHGADTITVPDAHLLFSGDFHRAGSDLIISDDLHRVVVPNYFHGAKRPTLVSPEGAPLDPAVIEALTGHTAYAQAGNPPAAKVVGHVAKMTGSASIVRNGVTIDVQTGDAVYQTDVVQTGSGSSLGLVLDDGTTFNLSANARLMLNDLTFDASSTSNSSFITLVEGAANFVAGQIARTGDMKVATPVAVIGIRGTAVKLEIAAADGKVDVSVIDQRDGQVHSVQVFKCVPTGVTDPQTGATCSAGDIIGTVTSSGPSLSLTPTTGVDVTVQAINKTPAQVAQEFSAFQATIDTYNIQKQINPNLPQHTENGGNNNANPQQTRNASLGSTPPDPPPTDPRAESTSTDRAVQILIAESVVPSTDLAVTSLGAIAPTTSSSTVNATSLPVSLPPSTTAPPITAKLTFSAGTSSSDNITSNDALSGTGLANTAVYFTIDGTPTASTVMTDANGAWSFTPSGLADGVHTIVASQTDTLGYTGTVSLSFTLDTTAPSGGTPSPVVAFSNTDNITAATAPTFTVALDPSVAVGDKVQLFLDGSPLVHAVTHVITTADVTAGVVDLTVTAGDLGADGSKQVTAQFSDAAGNSSTTSALSFTLDTTAPVVAITSAGGPISQAAQTITGVVDATEVGATVTILDGATALGTALVQNDGSWSTSVTLSGNGSHSIVAKDTDTAGNTGTSTPVVFTLSTTGPTVTESLAFDTGASASDNITSNDALTGTGLANTAVDFTIDGSLIATTVATDALGAWSFTPTGLAEGTHTIVASQTDAFNNIGTASLTFTLDTIAPAVAITTIEGGDNLINAAEATGGIQVSGTAEIGSTLTVNGSAVTVDGTGHWTTSITPAGQGALVVTAVATDAAGNSSSTTTNLTVDTIAPAVAITTIEGGDNLINAAEATGGIQVSGTAEIGSTLTVNGSAVTVDGTGHWTTSITPAGQGALVVTAVATDAAGNSSTATTNLTVDTIAPTVAITTIEGGDNLINASEAAGGIQISGTAEIGSTLTVNGAAVTVDGTGHWTTSITPAGQGALVVTAVATDAAGNTASTSTTLTVDTIAPTIAITNSGGSTNQADLLVTGTVDAADAGASVTILDGAAPVGSAVVLGDGGWSSNITLSNGSNSLTAKVSDLAGNTTTSTAVVYTLSTTGPAVTESLTFDTGSSAIDHITSNAALKGTGLANTVVHFTIDGVAVGATATADVLGAWSFTPTGLAEGTHTIVASQTDAFNNIGTASLTFTLDTIAPAVAITTIEGGDNLINASEAAGGIQVSGTAEIGSTLTVNGSAVTVDGTGHWATSITPAGQGALVVTAVATDAAGNTASTSTTLTVDTIAPAVAITTIEGGDNLINAAEAAGGIQVSGTAEIGSTLTVNGSAVTVDGTGHWTTSLTPAGQGALVVTAIATDAAGNSSTATTNLTVDTIAPTIAITNSGGSTNQAALLVTGTVDAADAGVSVTIFDGAAPVGSAVVQIDGSWSSNITLGNGSNSLTAQVTDLAGNTTTSAAVVYTLSTTGPAVTESLTFDTGSSAIDHITSNAALKGTGLANTVVHFTIDGVAVGATATADVLGAWSFTPTGLAEGTHTIVASQTDAFNNIGTASLTFTLDTIAPAVAITTIEGGDNLINASEAAGGIQVSGTAEIGSTLTVNGSAVTVDGTGHWATSITPAGQGALVVTAVATDAAGNSSTATTNLTVDTIVPTVVITTIEGGDNLINATEAAGGIQISGTAEIGSTLTVNGSAVTVDGTGHWTTSITPAGQGALVVTAVATDAAGNSSTATTNLTVDTIVPTVVITTIEGGDNLINATEAAGGIQISGTAEIGSTLTVNGSAVTVDSTGHWTTSMTPAGQGALVVTAIATDAAGNSSTATTNLTVDTIAPAVAITTIEGGDNLINATEAAGGIQISGTAEIGSTLTVNGSAVTVDSGGHWTTSLTPAGQGALVATAVATDTAGNSSTATTNLTVDTIAPTVVITTIEGGDNLINASEATGGIQVSGTAEIGSTLTVNGTAVTVDGTGNWTTSLTPAGQGAFVVTAIATDTAGNTTSTSTTLTVDTIAPTIAITNSGGSTNQAALLVTGTVDAADAGASVTIFDGAAPVGSAVVQIDGSWSSNITLGNGSNSLTAKVSDLAGNTTTSAAVVYTLSTTGPAVTESLTFDTGSSAIDHITSNAALKGTGLANTVVHFTIDGVAVGATATADVLGAWSFTPTGLAEGTHTIVASQTDAFNNIGTASLTFTLDTIAPAVAITTIEGGDNLINATEAAGGIQISGTAEIGSTLTVNGSAVTVDGIGHWTTSITPAGQGALVVTAVATDAAGNTASTSTTLTVDTIAPTVAITTIEGGDNLINAAEAAGGIQVSGTAEIGSTLTVNGSAVTVDGTGHWTTSLTPAGQGTLVVTAVATDAAGNSSTATTNLTVDTIVPTVVITTIEGGDNLINATEAAGGIQISGTAEIGSTLTVNGSAVTVDGTGHWTTSITPAGQGTLAVTAVATDAAGNSSTATTNLTVDTIAPAVAITTIEGGDNLINATEAAGGIQISGTAEIGSTLTVNGSAVTVDGTGNWTTSLTPAGQGALVVTAIATDTAGNSSTATTNLTVDTIVPTVAITTIEGGDNLIDASEATGGIQVSGTAEIGSTLTVNGSAVTVDGTGHWATSITPAGQGALVVTAVATDAAGNSSTATTNLTVDTIAPTVGITTIEGGDNLINATEAAGGIQISGTAEIGSTLTVNGSAVTVDGTGHWTTSLTPAGQGTLVVTAVATDAAGNSSTATTNLTVDTIVPTVVITTIEGGDNLINATEAAGGIQVSGTAEIGSTLTVNGTAVTVDGTGHWATSITPAGQGALVVTAVATDAAGNTASTSTTLTVDIIVPSGGVPDLVAASDTGSSATDNITSEKAPSFTQALNPTVSVGDTIQLLLSGSAFLHPVTHVITSADVSAGIVTLSVTAGDLGPDGGKQVSAQFSDLAGNNSTTSALSFTLDSTSPAEPLAITAIAANSGNSTSLTVSGTNGTLAAGEKIQVSSDGGATWTDVLQNTLTTWNLVDGTTHPLHYTYQARIIDAAGNTGSVVSQTVNGEGSSGVVADNLDPTSSSNTSVAVPGSPSISGAYDGVKAFTFGTGNVTVSSASGAKITGVKQYGIEAFSTSTGSLSVTTAANSQIRSGSAGIIAYNQATSIPQVGGVTTSSISVTANGTIDSGTTLTGAGVRPAGIVAVYSGGVANTVNPAVFGNVTVDNFATITADGGDGIRATNYGSGDVTVNDHAGSSIAAGDVYGISASVYGSGRISITMEAGAVINSGSYGIQATDFATAIAAAAGSTVTVTAHGTIHSGTHLSAGGAQPKGISAGYFPNGGVSDTNVNGTVFVDNFANVTADGGVGVNAYNYGNGNVTLLDEANTNVWGAQNGISAYSLSSGVGSSGSVTINVGPNATVTAGALYGTIAIDAAETNGGNISITTSTGDVINSGGSGISASNQAVGTATNVITGQISVTAAGTINSAFDMFTGGGQPGGIWGGYNPGISGTVNSFVHGNVVVDSAATINAASGVGIGLYNFGTGTVTATLEQSSNITAVSAGLNIFAQGGGNIVIVNHGAVTALSGYGITTGSGRPSISGSGIISISNLHDAGGPSSSGAISALGSLSSATIQINNWSSQDATIANSGTITATQFSTSRLNTAIGSYNGTNSANTGRAIVNNSGIVTGNVSFSAAFNINAASFNNNAGGVWNVNGQNYFGGTSNAINNAGTINASGASIFSSAGPLAVSNTGAINVLAFGAALFFGNVSGQGTFTIGDRAALEFGGSVAGGPTGQTITFVDGNGLLTLDSPSTFNGTIAGLSIGDTLNFLGGVTVSGASISGSTLIVTDSVHAQTYTYQVTGAQAGTAFNILSADKIMMISTSAVFLSDGARQSFAPSSGTTYILSSDTISGAGVGFAVNSTDSNSSDYNTLQINQTSSISVSGTAVNLTTTGANIAVINAGNITSTGGVGIATNSAAGSTDIINYGSVSGQTAGISARTSGSGPLRIVTGGSITGTTSNGISAISTLGAVNVTTTPGLLINAGANGIVVQNQGTSVPSGSSSIVISTSSGTINASTNAISVSYLIGTSAPSNPPTPPNNTVFGNINIENGATLNAASGVGISASNYGVGNISVSNNATITATAAGATVPGTTPSQYGIGAFNYGSGNTTVTTGNGSAVNSGSTGINVSNQATAIAAAAASTVTVVTLGTVNSGVNNNNSGSAPSGIQAGFNPGLAGVFSASVWGDVLVSANGNIVAAAGDGINAFNYGNGSVTVNLGSNVNIQALTSATSATGKAPYGIGASIYGPGDIAITMSSGDVITSGSNGINAVNLATSIDASAGALVTVYSVGSIHSKSILTNSGSQPSGIAAGFFGGVNATSNLNVNGRVIVNNDANVVADAGVGINAYHYGNGDITVNDASGTTVSGAQYGIEAHAEADGSAGNIAINVYSGATINSTTSYGIFAFTKGSGSISIITLSGDVINAGSVGINATNEATSIDATANSSIVVTAAGTINSGTGLTGTGNPPAGIIAGYLGGTSLPLNFPLTTINGDVIVSSTANIVAAAGDGIRAYTYGIGDITVNDLAGTITALGGSSPTNGFGAGISANNYGSGNITISTAVGNVINSGSSGISAVNKAPSSGAFVVPSTSVISVLSYATISSGTIPNGAGDAPAGILASYNPNIADVADDNVHGNIRVDDYGSIFAAAGTDGIRGENYGTGSVAITAEAGALISGGRYGVAAVSHDIGSVSVINYATAIGTTAAVNATTTSTGTAVIDNYGHLVGGIISYGATVTNELLADWSISGTSAFTGVSVLFNMGTIDSAGSSLISGLSSIVNTGTFEALSGSLELTAAMTGAGVVNIYDATVQFDAASDAHVRFVTSQPGELVLVDPAHFSGTVAGLDAGDILSLKGIAPASVNISTSGSLHVSYATGGFDLVGNYSASDFSIVSDGTGGTNITWNHHAPTIVTDQISVVHNANGTTTILGLQLSDSDASASTEGFTLSATTGADGSGSTVEPSASGGSLAAINGVLATGAVYNPGAAPPPTDKVTLTVTDSFGATDTVNFIFDETGTGPSTTLQGSSGKDVIFASNAVDMLSGGNGPDQFVFAPTSSGPSVQHTVADFVVGLDQLDVRQFVNLSGSSMPTETQQGSDTLITLDGHDTLLLKNVVATTLHLSDFIFNV